MIYIQNFNERFYYNVDSEIDVFIKSYYDFLINLKQMLEEDEYRTEYFIKNIIACYVSLTKSFINKFNLKKINKFKLKIDELKEITNTEIFKLSKLDELYLKLDKIKNDNEEQKLFSLKVNFKDFYNSLEASINKIIEYSKDKLSVEPNWEIIDGLTFLQSDMPKKEFKNTKYLLQIEFLKLQEWVKKNNKKLLITFDGRDAAGKGSNIDIITENMDPKYFRVETFGIPTKEESKNWFKRYEDVLPKEGEIVFFDRSWYTRMYVEKPMEFCTDDQYEYFMDNVTQFEKEILKNDIDIVKIWLSINKEIQKYRFELRKSNPLKYWKFSINDASVLNRWDDFTYYINLMVKKTSKIIKWNVINANDERKSSIDIMRSILNEFSYEHKDNKLVEMGTELVSENKKDNNKLYLFLDIDGVFIPFENEDSVDHECFYEREKWSKAAVLNLNKLYKEFKPMIVIISSYAKSKTEKEIQDAFIKIGFEGKINHDLKDEKSKLRFEQVMSYVTSNNIKRFIIIDDQPHDIKKIPELKKIWCQPNIKRAFTEQDLDECRKIINSLC